MEVFEIYHIEKNGPTIKRISIHATHEGAHIALYNYINQVKSDKPDEAVDDIFNSCHGFMLKVIKVQDQKKSPAKMTERNQY